MVGGDVIDGSKHFPLTSDLQIRERNWTSTKLAGPVDHKVRYGIEEIQCYIKEALSIYALCT